MLEKLNINEFASIYKMLEQSFPEPEYRDYEGQLRLFRKPEYGVYVMRDGEELMAMAAVYEFDDLIFIEHLAVAPERRNSGIGATMLREIRGFGKTMCLEVEPPDTDMCRRRIGFYERNGFTLNHWPYMMPSLGPGKPEVELMIMTTCGELSHDEFCRVRDTLYKHVYDLDA